MTIIVSKNNMNAMKIEESTFEEESQLQKYIYNNPESLPIYEIKDDLRLLIAAREFPTSSGPIDAIGFDEDGEIYIIETKLYKNPDKRLVVAQVLDYGAALCSDYNNFDGFLSILDAEINRKFNVSFFNKIGDFFGMNEEDVSIVINNMRNNLSNGNFRFVVLMDKLHDQLKQLIVFINQKSQFDIFAVEMEYYKFQEYEILIPKLFGSEVKKSTGVAKSITPRKKWDETTFFADAAEKLEEKDVEAIRKLYEFSKTNADDISWGTGATKGSINPKFFKISVRSIYTVSSDGTLTINFGWLNDNEQTIRIRDNLSKLLEESQFFEISGDYLKRDSTYAQVENWSPYVDEFIGIISDFLEKEV